MASEDRIRELEDKYEGFKVYDNNGDKIGKVDDLFIDESDREEYIGVKMGFLGMKSTLIPMDLVRVNESDKTIEVSESKDRVKDAPSFDDDEDITPEYEERIHSHFGLQERENASGHGSYGTYSGAAGSTETRDRDESSERREGDYGEGVSNQSGGSLGDTGVSNDRYDEDTRTSEASNRGEGYGEGVSDQSGAQLGDTGVTNDRFDEGSQTSDRERRSDDDDQLGASASESSERESYDSERMQDTGTSEGSSEASQSTGSPETRETTETETFQEGGRTKIRRRVRREEVEYMDEDQDR